MNICTFDEIQSHVKYVNLMKHLQSLGREYFSRLLEPCTRMFLLTSSADPTKRKHYFSLQIEIFFVFLSHTLILNSTKHVR